MFGRRYHLFNLSGFAVSIDASWFLLAILIIWSLATGVFPAYVRGLSAGTYWAMGVAGAVGLFLSIVVHEFFHSVVARRYGLPMKGITLFIFGGVAEMTEEPPSATVEFRMAIAGPIASVLIGVVCYVLALAGSKFWPLAITAVLDYLALINIALAIFNLIPAFPLDGGRVLRSFLWARWKSLRRATRVASRIGSGFGALLIAAGVVSVLFGDFIQGIWWFILGLFVRSAAASSYQQLLLRRALEGEPVRRFMTPNPVTVAPTTSIRDLVDDYIYRFHFKFFPVVERGRLAGCITTRQVKAIPSDEWSERTVGSVMEHCSPATSVDPDMDAVQALAMMQRSGASRLLVARDGELAGVITLKDMLDFLATKVELGDERLGAHEARNGSGVGS
ncbi:MAG TPA: site-2 protease family protein [Gemmatimonadaceae bacterium]|nr:site-2 protease family protein [Gemmatimonadaceae bacterium]